MGKLTAGQSGVHTSARTLFTKSIMYKDRPVECVQVSQYDHWLSHIVTGQSRKNYPLRDVEAFDIFHSQAAGGNIDDPMEDIMGHDQTPTKLRGPTSRSSAVAELRALKVPKVFGSDKEIEILALACAGDKKGKRVWLRLADVPWFLKNIRK